ncbi:hypothetical protein BamIOP4010DRAFT_6553 [Burkholderia ambifaria IOP40-10]|uniref:Uncharacterized protein n=1 Tax=Burkholderia ambifaria IOP40-10 TaxID=396596 RepID=B1FR92_9BURK|nr:hypothetical protein BamIOP4010DRAFT_6553 [Burkholderia ambifaria IOP40-10]
MSSTAARLCTPPSLRTSKVRPPSRDATIAPPWPTSTSSPSASWVAPKYDTGTWLSTCFQVAPRSVLRSTLPRIPYATQSPFASISAPNSEPWYGDGSLSQVAPLSVERSSVPLSPAISRLPWPSPTIAFRWRSPAGVFSGCHVSPASSERSNWPKLPATNSGPPALPHTDSSGSECVESRRTSRQCTPASSLRTIRPSWPTAIPSVGVTKLTCVSVEPRSGVIDALRQWRPASSLDRITPRSPTATMRVPARASPLICRRSA